MCILLSFEYAFCYSLYSKFALLPDLGILSQPWEEQLKDSQPLDAQYFFLLAKEQ